MNAAHVGLYLQQNRLSGSNRRSLLESPEMISATPVGDGSLFISTMAEFSKNELL
jgi:hypothetical protein